MLGDLLLADRERVLFTGFVVFKGAAVIFRRNADKRTQRQNDRAVLHLVIAGNALGILRALRGLNDHELIRLHGDAVRVEIVFFTAAAKADTDYFSQKSSSNSTAKPPSAAPVPTL